VIHIKSDKDIDGMRKACALAAKVLIEVGKQIKRGATTQELDDFVDKITTEAGALSAPYQYRAMPTYPPFPGHLCTSINNVVCHGVPSKDCYLRKGDIINCDITVKLDGYHGDTSKTFIVGKTKPEIRKLVEITEQAMYEGIAQIKPGACISDIGKAIQEFVAPHGYGIVTQLTGHGIGLEFHEDPQVFHYYNPKYKLKLKPGMIFTVEPMLNLGKPDVALLNDGWTIVTTDNKPSAQFEHTCLVTPEGVEVLTKYE